MSFNLKNAAAFERRPPCLALGEGPPTGMTSCGGPVAGVCGTFSGECWVLGERVGRPGSLWKALSVHKKEQLSSFCLERTFSDFPCLSTFYFVFYLILETFV